MILSAIIIIVVISLINYQGTIKLRKVDKLDFLTCMVAFFGILLVSIQNGPRHCTYNGEQGPRQRNIKLVLANPVGSITERLCNSVVGKTFGSDRVFFNVAKAIAAAPHKAHP
ncbi:hypothetical protein E2562_036500 [Oryza meyeriana var. granulata]|uniref:SLC26A/SulP transporter domain-containing protein n=1 Tax=Oryza meyeriana var. granulata TaxID=110450 RepID=A0A6G1DAJ9_9ORYZ|nr:hypothetical protein E2562_036500 [Oryza meyeriana var. granulata]